MTDLVLSRAGVRLRLTGPDDLRSLVPALRHYELTGAVGEPTAAQVSVVDSARPRIDLNPSGMTVAVPLREFDAAALQVVVDQAFSAAVDAAGLVVLHSSAVHFGDRVVALWGPSGAGKTTVAFALHQRGGCDLVSNGSLLVGLADTEPVAVGSAKEHVKLRSSSLRDGPNHDCQRSPTAGYEEKTELPITVFRRHGHALPTRITDFVMLRVVADIPSPTHVPADPRRAIVRLYEDATRHLHGTEAILMRPDGSVLTGFPSLGTQLGHRRRVAVLSALVSRATRLTGSLPGCVAAVETMAGAAATVEAR